MFNVGWFLRVYISLKEQLFPTLKTITVSENNIGAPKMQKNMVLINCWFSQNYDSNIGVLSTGWSKKKFMMWSRRKVFEKF